jgi:hypothetical protein
VFEYDLALVGRFGGVCNLVRRFSTDRLIGGALVLLELQVRLHLLLWEISQSALQHCRRHCICPIIQ